jgi:FMN phosphatase YigB (HAD superfamily)
MKNKKQKIIIFDLDDTLFDSTNQPEDTGNDDWALHFFDEFKPILESKEYSHILVTRGDKELQNRKIDIMGIRKYFTEIYIVHSDESKHEQFIDIKNKFPHEEIVVIGNRIDCEVRYGNLLNLKTIHIKHGKYESLIPKDKHEFPTHAFSIHEISDFKKYL